MKYYACPECCYHLSLVDSATLNDPNLEARLPVKRCVWCGDTTECILVDDPMYIN